MMGGRHLVRAMLVGVTGLALVACAEPEPDYKAEYPRVPGALADQIIDMTCTELAVSRFALELIEERGAPVLMVIGKASFPDAWPTIEPLLAQESAVRADTIGLVNRMTAANDCL
ncbi:MAG: hypothetical protein AAGJ96_11460 [Pseudomonadota bacterium]